MASQPPQSRHSSASPSVMWDNSHVHAQRMAQGQALMRVPNGAGPVTRRTSGTTTTATTSATTSANTPRRPPQRPASGARSSPESELKMSFDPMKDLHMWTMWRAAVNGRIVDETRRRTRSKPAEGGEFDPHPYGRALVKTPLDRFIRVGQGSQGIAGDMMDPHGEGRGAQLETSQFVYYGVPRVVLRKAKPTVHLP